MSGAAMSGDTDIFGDRSRRVLLDGGLSTALERAGHRLDGALWTARLLADQPDALIAAHSSYLEAGAEVLITASYQASVEGFVAAGVTRSDARHLIMSSTTVARRAIDRVDADAAGTRRYVAASVGPYGATLHDGSEYHGNYDVDWQHVRRFHRERLEILIDSGPDLLAVETIPSLAEAEIVLDEASRVSTLPMWLSLSCRNGSSTCHGEPIADVGERLASHDQVVAIGVNCTAPEYVHDLLVALGPAARGAGTRLIAYSNHGGRWDGTQWHGTAELDVETHVPAWLAAGATIIGGCCGIGPTEIARIGAVLAA
jgi:homocysteine S-methyltransferase